MSTPLNLPSQARHLHWGVQALWTELEPLLPGLSVEVLARSASTNTELLERARIVPPAQAHRAGDPAEIVTRVGRRQADTQPCLLVAEHQMAGRGRMGRGWQSTQGTSLTFSLALPLTPPAWSGLSLAVGVALAEVLQPAPAEASPRLGLKWPNDLYLVGPGGAAGSAGGRKLGGILVETLAVGSQRLAVIGIGLNIAPINGQLAAELGESPACLREIDPHASAPATLARIALPLVRALKRFDQDGFAAFAERYAALDLLLDQGVLTTDPRAPQGVARGVDSQGALRVETSSGLHSISSGEVSVRFTGST